MDEEARAVRLRITFTTPKQSAPFYIVVKLRPRLPFILIWILVLLSPNP